MKRRSPFTTKTLLYWVAIISLVISATVFFALKDDTYEASVQQTRLLIPMIGIIIAGLCLIAGTAERWFR